NIIPTIGLALALRNYWALIAGSVVGTLMTLAMSYRMHPYRPRLSLEKARAFLSFSVSIVALNFAKFFKRKVDVLLVGGKGNASIMGSYNVASELSVMLTQELVMAVWRGLYPTFGSIAHDRERFLVAYGYVLGTIAVLCLPMGFGLSSVAEDVVAVVLGSKWGEAVVPLKWLSIAAALAALTDAMCHQILVAAGRENRAAMMNWVQLLILASLVYLASRVGGIET